MRKGRDGGNGEKKREKKKKRRMKIVAETLHARANITIFQYNGWPQKKYTFFKNCIYLKETYVLYLNFLMHQNSNSRLHIARDIQHIGNIYLVFMCSSRLGGKQNFI